MQDLTIVVRELILSGGRTIVLVGAVASLLLTLGYLFSPAALSKLGAPVNKLFSVDEWLIVHRIIVGAIFLIITVMLFSVLLFVK